MLTIAEELKQKTLAYWKLSSIWNGRRNVNLATEDAMRICNKICEMTSPDRPLHYQTFYLKTEIIEGSGQKVPGAVILVLPLKKQEVGA